MLRRPNLILAALLAALVVAVPAVASDPSSGTVSFSAPKVAWTGTATGYGVVPTNILLTTAGNDPACPPQACDTFKLTVADSADLIVTAACKTADQFTELHVHKPDGTTVYVQSDQGKPATVKVKAAPKGDYTIDVLTNDDPSSGGEYSASAELKVPGAAPAPAAPAPGAPAPTPTATAPAPAPAPAATLTLKTTKLSARKARKAAKLGIASSGPVTNVKAVIKRGSKVVAKAALASLNGSGTLTFKLAKKLKPGSYAFAATASDVGRTVGVTAKLKVTR